MEKTKEHKEIVELRQNLLKWMKDNKVSFQRLSMEVKINPTIIRRFLKDNKEIFAGKYVTLKQFYEHETKKF